MGTWIIHFKISREDAPGSIDLSELRRDVSILLDSVLADVGEGKWAGGKTSGEEFEIVRVVEAPGPAVEQVRSALERFQVGSLLIEKRERFAA
ncbi:MAG: hypothetical protein GY859_01415 [Desulfobacterales bacterium]|nr:hypothetical protein [Desulfobacterales bacterium]